jgi:hypothetical protein
MPNPGQLLQELYDILSGGKTAAKAPPVIAPPTPAMAPPAASTSGVQAAINKALGSPAAPAGPPIKASTAPAAPAQAVPAQPASSPAVAPSAAAAPTPPAPASPQASLANPAAYQKDAAAWYAGVAWKGAADAQAALSNFAGMQKGMPPDFIKSVTEQIKKGKQSNPTPADPNKPGSLTAIPTPQEIQAYNAAWNQQYAGAGNNPVAAAAREKNRIAGRFTTPAYHGQAGNLDQGWKAYTEHRSPSGKKRFAAAQPELAELYKAGHVKKYFLNTNDYYMFNAGGQSWGIIRNKAIDEAVKAGKKGIIVHNVADEPNLTMEKLGPQTTYVVFDMSTARSENAAFDPAKWHLPNLLASGGAIALASGVPGLTDRAEAAPLPKRITLYHASPEEFTKFEPAKGGSGVGRAEFSEGAYLAGNPDTMEHYARRFEQERGKAVRYHVTADIDQNHLVDFDKPFDQQSAQVQEALKRAGIGNLDDRRADVLANIGNPATRYLTGDESAKLKELGVQGVRYLDKGSRAQGEGTHNYVIYDPQTLDIVKKYGIAALITGGAGAAALGTDQAEAAENPMAPTHAAQVQELLDSVLHPETAHGDSRIHDILNRALAGDTHEGAERIKDIPGDIAGVFREGVEALRGAGAAQRERAPSSVFLNPLRPRAGQEGGLHEFLSVVSGAADVALSPVKGAVRSLVARPAAGTMEPETRSFSEMTPSERARASARRPFTGDVHSVEMLTDMALPGVGLVPWTKTGALFTKPSSPLTTFTAKVGDDMFRLRQTATADKAELKQRMLQVPEAGRTQEVQEIVYNLIERKDVSKLPADQQAFLADPQNLANAVATVKAMAPFRLELSNLYSRLRKLGIPDTDLVDPEYVHRRVVGHDYTLDPVASQSGQQGNPVGFTRTLPQTTGAMQSRKMMGGEAADGSRVVLSEDDAGNWQVHTGGKMSTPATPHPTQPDAFIYNGKTWQIGQATSLEIEQATAKEPKPVKYYKNALANTVDALQRMRAVARHVEWLDQLKKSPVFRQHARRGMLGYNGMERPKGVPKDWEQSTMPSMKGWYIEPRLRAAFDDFYSPGGGPNGLLEGFRKVNQFATASLFWQPTPHIENVFGHWVVGRGFDWIKPSGIKSLFVDGATAIKAVTTQDANYRRLLKAGSGMLFGSVKNADFYRDIAKLAGMDIQRVPARWDPIARTLGVGPSDLVRAWYSASSKVLWWANDLFMMQRVLELERRGMPLAKAIKEAEKHIPNYRVPTEVLGSRLFSQILQEPAFTIFSRYHYGMFNSYANMVRDLVAGKTGQERIDAIGNLMMLGLLTWVAYPLVQTGLQKAMGDEDVKKIPRGPSAVPSALVELYEGDRRWEQIAAQIAMLPGPMQGVLTVLGGGNDPFTGQPITEPRSPAGRQVAQGADWALGKVAQPWQLINKRPESEGGNSPVRTILNQVLGLQDTSEAALRGQRIRKKVETKRARKREVRPRGVIERLYGGTDE